MLSETTSRLDLIVYFRTSYVGSSRVRVRIFCEYMRFFNKGSSYLDFSGLFVLRWTHYLMKIL